MAHRQENDKALRYIAQLDEARCAGRWKDVPELCRKVEKHAPHRKCLTLTARSEAQIAAHSVQRPSTAASTASSGLSTIIPKLLTAIDEEDKNVQDAFQATVCLAWLHYVLDEPALAISKIPKDLGAVALKLSQEAAPSGWTRVCIVKGAYFKGASQEQAGHTQDAVNSYNGIIPWLSSLKTVSSESAQFKLWSETLMIRLCLLSDLSTEAGEHAEPVEALRTYRFWAKIWESTRKGSSGSNGLNSSRSRRLAWKAYYDTLSVILRDQLPYDVDRTQPSSPPRLQQRAELKKVETIYESLLLKETMFPKASESNAETEAWTDSVMNNWRILCGPTWRDEDLGEGGKEAAGRVVLDILYRAATKTFHSTQILRHLFTVHASLAEFELAFKAYDSYVEIVTRGKDRAEKTGEEEVDIDDDSTILRTATEAIRILCRFGSRKEAGKAIEVSDHLEKWLEQAQHTKSSTVQAATSHVAPKALAVAYCAIGISQAQWARYTYQAESRSSLQNKAVQYLRKSLDPQFEDSTNLETLYALALVLAEMRDIPGAIKIVKRALSPATRSEYSFSADGILSGGDATEYGRERKLIPLWHLLALLLTARSDFTQAEKACEAAFEQFDDPSVLFGPEDDDQAFRSEHLNEMNGKGTGSGTRGIVDQMEAFERSGILQIKMTQLALVEVIEGSHAAVDSSDELLALYSRLFGDAAAQQTKLEPPVTTAPPPKSAVGTIRGSIFRSRGSLKSTNKESVARNASVASSRASTVATHAPTIQVTDEDGADHANGHHHHHLFHHKHNEEKSIPKRNSSKLQKRSLNSIKRKSEADSEKAPTVPEIPDAGANGISNEKPRRPSVSSSVRKSVESGDRSLRSIPHNINPSSAPPPPGHSTQPPKQDVRLPTPFPHSDYIPPDPRFSKLQERRQRDSLLTSIWIFISGLYVRAGLYEDAIGAVKEAFKLVKNLELESARESSTSKAFSEQGWGGGKSVEELWGDAFTARGEILVAQSLKHDARSDFERAVQHFPNHPEAIVGLSNILLDIYGKVIPLELSKEPAASTMPPPLSASSESPESKQLHLSAHTPSAENQMSPPELNRLAARDRAYGLLSTLTKLGPGWDFSEAWYALARAYEESGQLDKAKEVLWWCVELEDTHPVRPWHSVKLGGFVL